MRREKLAIPSGFLIVGTAGAGGVTLSGLAFFLGRAMTPVSPLGPPESGVAWSGGWGCCPAGGAEGSVWAWHNGADATATTASIRTASENRRRTETNGRIGTMTTSLLYSIRDCPKPATAWRTALLSIRREKGRDDAEGATSARSEPAGHQPSLS